MSGEGLKTMVLWLSSWTPCISRAVLTLGNKPELTQEKGSREAQFSNTEGDCGAEWNSANLAQLTSVLVSYCYITGFRHGSVVKNLPANARDTGSIVGLGRSPGEGNGTHSSVLAWRIPWREEPGGLQSVGPQSRTRLSD